MREITIEETQIYLTRKRLIEATLAILDDRQAPSLSRVQADCGKSESFIRGNPAYSDIGDWILSLKTSEPLPQPQPQDFEFSSARRQLSHEAIVRRVERACKEASAAGLYLSFRNIAELSEISERHLVISTDLRGIIAKYRKPKAKQAKPVYSAIVWQDKSIGERVIKLPNPVYATSYRTGEFDDCTHQWQRWSKRLKCYRQCGYLTEPQFKAFLKSRQRQKGVAA